MLTEARWQKEQELMRSVFPEFAPFTRGSRFGFEGRIKGARSGVVYGVTLEADQATYPQWPPHVCMHPRIGIHWIGEGDNRRLCVEREWKPARSTFANTLLVLLRYLDEHDPHPGATLDRAPDRAAPPRDDCDLHRDPGAELWPVLHPWRGRGPY